MLVALHAARDEAERANRLKDEFLATLSHELRTPLNAVLGWVSMLRRAPVSAERLPHILEIIERNAQAQARLIGDVLDVSRIITGRLRLEPRARAAAGSHRERDRECPARRGREEHRDPRARGRHAADSRRSPAHAAGALEHPFQLPEVHTLGRTPRRSNEAPRFAGRNRGDRHRRRPRTRVSAVRLRSVPAGRPDLHAHATAAWDSVWRSSSTWWNCTADTSAQRAKASARVRRFVSSCRWKPSPTRARITTRRMCAALARSLRPLDSRRGRRRLDAGAAG